MSDRDPHLAERSRRHRERQAQERDAIRADLHVILAAVNSLAGDVQYLRKAVDNLSRRGGQPLRNGSADSVDSANVAQRRRAPARAREETVAPAPYGGLGATPYVNGNGGAHAQAEEDAWRIVKALAGHGPASIGAIRDHLESLDQPLDLRRTTAAMVLLQSRGEATREVGDTLTGRPDTWRLTAPETPAALDDPPSPRAANRQDPDPSPVH